MKKIIIDSSSAILLNRCGIFEIISRQFDIYIPEKVFSELTIPGHDGSELFRNYFSTARVKTCEKSGDCSLRHGISLHAGEHEVILLYIEGGYDYIIIDDGRGSAYCRDNNIPYINALLAVKVLYFNNSISQHLYTAAWDWLKLNGRYSKKILDRAEQADRSVVSLFL